MLISKKILLVNLLMLSFAGVGLSQPTVLTVTPAQNALNVAQMSSIQIQFNEAMDQSSLIADSTIYVAGSQTGSDSGTISYDNGTFTVTYNPLLDFKAGEIITITVTTGVKNIAMIPLDTSYSWRFTVIASVADTFAAKVNYATSNNPISIAAADLDGDGDLDLVTANSSANVFSLLRNTGNGQFNPSVPILTGSIPQSIAAADIDGDGDMDIVTANTGQSSDSVSMFLNYGNGTFANRISYQTGNDPYTVIFVDVDGDGDMDCVTANLAGTASVLKNNGDGTFAAKTDYPTGDTPYSVASADVDRDGDMDLAVANAGANNISILYNNGNGNFPVKINFNTTSGPTSVSFADVDSNGDMDIIAVCQGVNKVSVMLNNGTGGFPSKSDYNIGELSYAAIPVDIDGDGYLDIVAANSGSNNMSVLKNNGNGTFASKEDYPTGLNPRSLTSADLDGDGDLDLAVANFGLTSSNVSVFLSTVTPPLPVEIISFIAIPKQLNTELKWKTATEVNNYGFEIEKCRIQLSEDRIRNTNELWATVGFVEGNGTSNTPKEYSFIDNNNSSGTFSYRLKQIDRDGRFEYSQSVEVTVGNIPTEFSLFQNYPNPFNPSTTIGFSIPSNAMVRLTIFDLIGREVRTLVHQYYTAGYHSHKVNLNELASGNYFYRLEVFSDKGISFESMKRLTLIK